MSNSKESEMKNMGIFMNIFKRAAALAILVSAAADSTVRTPLRLSMRSTRWSRPGSSEA